MIVKFLSKYKKPFLKNYQYLILSVILIFFSPQLITFFTDKPIPTILVLIFGVFVVFPIISHDRNCAVPGTVDNENKK